MRLPGEQVVVARARAARRGRAAAIRAAASTALGVRARQRAAARARRSPRSPRAGRGPQKLAGSCDARVVEARAARARPPRRRRQTSRAASGRAGDEARHQAVLERRRHRRGDARAARPLRWPAARPRGRSRAGRCPCRAAAPRSRRRRARTRKLRLVMPPVSGDGLAARADRATARGAAGCRSRSSTAPKPPLHDKAAQRYTFTICAVRIKRDDARRAARRRSTGARSTPCCSRSPTCRAGCRASA